MIIKSAISGCRKNTTSSSSSSSKRTFLKANYHDDFCFEIPRLSVITITSDTDTSLFKEDFIDDSENGVWKGWVFANTLTDRYANLKIQTFYLEVNRNYITYRTKVNGNLIFLKSTKQMKLICEKSDGPCTPTEYLQVFDDQNYPFQSLFQLREAIFNFIDQMPTVDEKGCVVIEFDEPRTRTRTSEIICSLFPEDGESLRLAFSNAYYLSMLRAEMPADISLASYMTEIFPVQIWEEKRLMDDHVQFNETGLIKAPNGVLLYSYGSIANDKLGNRCAFWYKNLQLPSEFGNHDPNCCFTFSLKNGKTVFICADNPVRCIRDGKMILLKMRFGCLAQIRAHLSNPFENENTVSPFISVDNYFKVLYDDSENGVWRGLVFHHKLGSDETSSDNPNYMKIENGYIFFYQDENVKNIEGVEIAAKEQLVIRNMYFTCEQSYTCDIKHYIEYFKENVSDDIYDIYKLKDDIQTITAKLPTGSSEDSCCTIISFLDENGGKQNHIICTRVEDQGDKIKKALTKSLNNIILNSNIMREIPLANLEDNFNIQYYDAKNNQIQDLKVKFGKYYMFDVSSGQKILKYTDIKPDSYGSKCALWNSQLTLPNQMTIDSKECCFMFNKNDLSYYICSNGNYHCLKKSRIMMKTIKEGCMKEGNGLNMNGNNKIDVPEIRNPNTEILG